MSLLYYFLRLTLLSTRHRNGWSTAEVFPFPSEILLVSNQAPMACLLALIPPTIVCVLWVVCL